MFFCPSHLAEAFCKCSVSIFKEFLSCCDTDLHDPRGYSLVSTSDIRAYPSAECTTYINQTAFGYDVTEDEKITRVIDNVWLIYVTTGVSFPYHPR